MGDKGVRFDIKKQFSNRDTFNVAGDFKFFYKHNELNEESILPFEVPKKTFEEETLLQLSKGAFTPDDILIKSMDKCIFRGVYIPVYYFKGNYSALLTYTAIFNKEVPYKDYNIEYKDGEAIRIPVTKFKTIEDPHPLEKPVSDTYAELAIATDISSILNIDFNTSDLILFFEKLSYDQFKIKKYQDNFIDGFEKIDFSIGSNLSELEIKKRIRKRIEKNINQGLQGDSQRNIHLNKPIHINVDIMERIYLPFWIAIYSYNHKESLFIMDGSEAPHSRDAGHMAKVIEVVLAIFCPNRSRAAGYGRLNRSSRIFHYNKPKDVNRIVNLLIFATKIFSSILFLILMFFVIITLFDGPYSLKDWYIKFSESVSVNLTYIFLYSAIISLPIGIIRGIILIEKSKKTREDILKSFYETLSLKP